MVRGEKKTSTRLFLHSNTSVKLVGNERERSFSAGKNWLPRILWRLSPSEENMAQYNTANDGGGSKGSATFSLFIFRGEKKNKNNNLYLRQGHKYLRTY